MLGQAQSDVFKLLFFVKTTDQNPKDSSFTIINDKEKQQICPCKKLEPVMFWDSCFKTDWN